MNGSSDSADNSDTPSAPDPEFFKPDDEFTPDALHQLVADDVYAVNTRRQTKQLAEEAAKEISKPYAQQLQEAQYIPGNSSGDHPSLKGVHVAMPIEAIATSFPQVCQSLRSYLDSPEPFDIHALNSKSSSYSECTYADISVNKVKVRAIIDSGAPINIVSTRLVKKLGLAPDVAHCQTYGTAGPETTTLLGAYSALPL